MHNLLRYVSSEFETLWMENYDKWQNENVFCEVVKSQKKIIDKWIFEIKNQGKKTEFGKIISFRLSVCNSILETKRSFQSLFTQRYVEEKSIAGFHSLNRLQRDYGNFHSQDLSYAKDFE